jgi:hypothetical protein
MATWKRVRGGLAAATVLAAAGAVQAQPDVMYLGAGSSGNDIGHYGPVGNIRAYIFGTATCNAGPSNLAWVGFGSPSVGFNVYRLQGGRLVQLGQSWVKTACCAATFGSCGGRTCNGASGNQLGSGCIDVYGSGWNANQTRLMPRSQVNPWTGQHGTIPGGSNTAISRRCQVAISEFDPTNFPNAQYFIEGVYVADDEQPGPAKHNNASYQRVAATSAGVLSSIPGAAMQVGQPAINAWRAHGGGPNVVDTSVHLQTVDVPNEGRFHVAHKVTDNGNGTWHYEYAIFNLNSHVAGGSLSIPVPTGVTISNVGFRDVDYHSGEPYDNTDWVIQVGSGSVTWHSPQTFAQNPNSNALRWGTMYNFWFDADAEPSDGEATLGLFRPHTPDSVTFTVGMPGGIVCQTDWNHDNIINSLDISVYVSHWLMCVENGDLGADFNGDGTVNSADISAFLTEWLNEVLVGC